MTGTTNHQQHRSRNILNCVERPGKGQPCIPELSNLLQNIDLESILKGLEIRNCLGSEQNRKTINQSISIDENANLSNSSSFEKLNRKDINCVPYKESSANFLPGKLLWNDLKNTRSSAKLSKDNLFMNDLFFNVVPPNGKSGNCLPTMQNSSKESSANFLKEKLLRNDQKVKKNVRSSVKLYKDNLITNELLSNVGKSGNCFPILQDNSKVSKKENYLSVPFHNGKCIKREHVDVNKSSVNFRNENFTKQDDVLQKERSGINETAKQNTRNYSLVEFHKHPKSDSNSGLLQICCSEKQSIYQVMDNTTREMDKIIFNPGKSICKDILDNTPELVLPGPFKYNIKPKEMTLNSNRQTLDVLGLFILLVDMIYSCGSVSHVNYGEETTPLEFNQDVVKCICVMKAAFPSLFEELQKVVMYSTFVGTMRKNPFKWNRCMVHVLEDLIIHPLHQYIDESTMEFKILSILVQKRAKLLFMQDASLLPKISEKYRETLNSHFSKVYSQDIKELLTQSARYSLQIHIVKNIKYLMADQTFIETLTSVWNSCNINC